MVEFTQAYPVSALEQAQRRLAIDDKQNTIWLEDRFRFADLGHQVNEVLVTWLPVSLHGAPAVIQGRHHHLRLSIENPSGAEFELESLVGESQANVRDDVLQRLRVRLSDATMVQVQLRLDISPIRA